MTANARWTPPSWLRHVTPWKLLGCIDRHFDTCWANMVMWKQFGGNDWWPHASCFRPYDYCGKYDGKPMPDCEEVCITFKDSL